MHHNSKINSLHPILIFIVLFIRLHSELAENNIVFLSAIFISIIGIAMLWAEKIRLNFYTKWQLLFYIYYAISMLWADDPNMTRINLIATFGRCIIMLYISLYVSDISRIKKVMDIYIYVLLIVQVYIYLFKGLTYITHLRDDDLLTTTSWNANGIGMSVAFGIFYIYYIYSFFKEQITNSQQMIYRFYVVLGLVTIMMTGSKKALFEVFILIIGLYFFTHERRKILTVLAVVVIVPIIYIAILKIPILYNIMGHRVEEFVLALTGEASYNASDRTRDYLIQRGIEWFKLKPWLGHGMACFKSLYVAETQSDRALYAHNNYIEIAVGGGMVGILVYYWGYLKIIIKGIKSAKYAKAFILTTMIAILILEYGLVSYLMEMINLPLIICLALIEYSKETEA